MTKRERQYHKIKASKRLFNRLFYNLAFFCPSEPVGGYSYEHYMDAKMGINQVPEPNERVTVTLTKYNLPNNVSLSEGQLN